MCPKQEEKKQKINGLEPIWKSQSKTNSLIIAVSVGGGDFEGKSLSTLIEAINKLSNKITNCIIAVGDTLQRHNYQLNGKTSDEAAFSMAEKAGDEWLKRNNEVLKKLIIPYHITRWNDWLNSKEYTNAFLETSALFKTDSAFKEAIQCSVKAFSSRFTKRHEEFGFKEEIIPKVLEQACQAYLLEECAIIMKLWPINKDNHCEFILYPGKMTKALAYAYDKFVQKKELFKWNKFAIKEKNTILKDSSLCNLEEKVAAMGPYNEQERRFFILAFAACKSITSQPDLSKTEKVKMLAEYTHITFFSQMVPVNNIESSSKERNFFQNNI